MLASKQTDPVVGIDVHWEMVPTPAGPIPTPIPNPFVGMIFDPLGLAVGIVIDQVIGALMGSPPTGAVIVNMLPATNTGTEAKGFGHIIIPPGTSWAPMPSVMPVIIPKEPPEVDNPAKPDDDAIVITGSQSVHVMGSNFARLGDLAMSCSEPVRLPSSVIMAVPKGLPVLVGGPPALDALSAAGAFIRTQWVSHQLHNALSYLRSDRLRRALSRVVCFFTGHPVDVATGRMMTDHVDVDLPGPLPLSIERVYDSSASSRSTALGHGWSHSLDQKVWLERGRVVYLADDGREIEFDTFGFPDHVMRAGDELFHAVDRLTLQCLGPHRWTIWTPDGVAHDFAPVSGGDPHVAVLQSKRTRDGHRIDLHYDERGLLSWVRDSAKRRLLFDHDAAGRLVRIKLPVSRGEGHYEHVRYTYDEHGDLVAVTDAAGASWTFEYSGHLMTRETDRAGLSFYFGYDGIGQDAYCVRTWGDGGIYDHELVYDKTGRVTAVTNSLGETTIYKMSAVGLVTEVVDAFGATTKYEHDPRTLQQTSEIDPLGNTTRYSYDARGNRVRVEGRDGAVATFEHDERFLDSPIRAVDPNGGEWRWQYDAFGRMTGRANPFGHWTRFQHEEGRLRRATTPGGAVTALDYDEAGLVSRVVSPTGAETRLEHDRLGRLIKIVNPRGGVERRQHDAVGNLVRVEEPHGVVRHFEYDREQNLTRAADTLRDVSFTYTGYHRLHERHEAGTTIGFHYDTEDRLASVENEASERYDFELDARGLVSVERGFDGFERTYARDIAGRVTRVTKASGRTSELSYDSAGRITDVAHSDGTFERYRYRADGALVEASNDAAEVRFERDAMGRITREVTRLPDGSEHWVQSGHGPDGHRVRVQSSDGHLHHIERDLAGDVTRVELEGGRWHADFERDPLGLELSRSFPNGITSRWHRDVVGRPMRRTVTWRGQDAEPRVLNDKRYQWDGDDQIRAILDDELGHAHYKHDARGRLVWARLPWGEEQHRAMDAVGNIYRSPDLDDRRYGRGGRIEEADGTHYRHDDDGNLIEQTDVLGDTTRYRWNGAGMLSAVELPDGREVRFTYDVMARRLSKHVLERHEDELRPVKEVRWSWDGHNPLVEIDSEEGKSTWVFEPETFNPLAKLARGSVLGAVADHLGSVTEWVGEGGSAVWRGAIDVYGVARPVPTDAGAMPGWPGQYCDGEVALAYNRFRYFSFEMGAYVSVDPLGLAGGTLPYAYVSDPIVYLDALGLIERFFRYVSEAEAQQSAGNMGGDNNLHPRPHGTTESRGPKWITEQNGEPRLGSSRPSHRLEIEADDGTGAWLNEHPIDFDDVTGPEASVPDRVIVKSTEPGSHGVGRNLLDQLNSRIRRITAGRERSEKRRRGGCRR